MNVYQVLLILAISHVSPTNSRPAKSTPDFRVSSLSSPSPAPSPAVDHDVTGDSASPSEPPLTSPRDFSLQGYEQVDEAMLMMLTEEIRDKRKKGGDEELPGGLRGEGSLPIERSRPPTQKEEDVDGFNDGEKEVTETFYAERKGTLVPTSTRRKVSDRSRATSAGRAGELGKVSSVANRRGISYKIAQKQGPTVDDAKQNRVERAETSRSGDTLKMDEQRGTKPIFSNQTDNFTTLRHPCSKGVPPNKCKKLIEMLARAATGLDNNNNNNNNHNSNNKNNVQNQDNKQSKNNRQKSESKKANVDFQNDATNGKITEETRSGSADAGSRSADMYNERSSSDDEVIVKLAVRLNAVLIAFDEILSDYRRWRQLASAAEGGLEFMKTVGGGEEKERNQGEDFTGQVASTTGRKESRNDFDRERSRSQSKDDDNDGVRVAGQHSRTDRVQNVSKGTAQEDVREAVEEEDEETHGEGATQGESEYEEQVGISYRRRRSPSQDAPNDLFSVTSHLREVRNAATSSIQGQRSAPCDQATPTGDASLPEVVLSRRRRHSAPNQVPPPAPSPASLAVRPGAAANGPPFSLPDRLPKEMTPEMKAMVEGYIAWREKNGYGKMTRRWG